MDWLGSRPIRVDAWSADGSWFGPCSYNNFMRKKCINLSLSGVLRGKLTRDLADVA